MACLPLEGQGLGLARSSDSDVLIRTWSSSSLGSSFSMLDSDSGSTWCSQHLQAYIILLVGNLSGNPSSSFHCHHRSQNWAPEIGSIVYVSLGQDKGFGHPQATMTEWRREDCQQCSYQVKRTWGLVKTEVISCGLEKHLSTPWPPCPGGSAV